MARNLKKAPTIQKTVDVYADGIAQRAALMAKQERNEGVIAENGDALLAHVKAQNTIGPVAYLAKNGRTVLVKRPLTWDKGEIETIEPGKQEIAQPEPVNAELTADVLRLLGEGAHEEAQKLIAQATQNQSAAAKTATEVMEHAWKEYGKGYAGILADTLIRPEARLYFQGFDPARVEPAIAQQTYKSAALGPIKLSRRMKVLLLEERQAIQRAVVGHDYNAGGMVVSRARGNIAQYVSELEQKVNELTAKLG